jgi:hypothetical protein
LFYGPNILDAGNTNYPLLGADPDQLQKYGYTQEFGVTEVPGLDEWPRSASHSSSRRSGPPASRNRPDPLGGDRGVRPFLFDNDVSIISERTVNYVYSGFDGLMALTRSLWPTAGRRNVEGSRTGEPRRLPRSTYVVTMSGSWVAT